MKFERVSIFNFLLICFIIFVPTHVMACREQKNPPPVVSLKLFKELLATIGADFTFPEGFDEVKLISNEKLNYQYALRLPDGSFEMRIQVTSLKSDWRSYEEAKGEKVTPDSLYNKRVLSLTKRLAGEGSFFARGIPPEYLQQYNADLGCSYYLNLADSPETNHYQFALLVLLQKNHLGNITVTCMGNQRGPEFFRNITKLRNCIKFNN